MSVSRLEQELKDAVKRAENGNDSDLTLSFQMLFSTPDRSFSKVTMNSDGSLLVIVGLRSEILEPFERFTDDFALHYSACDLPGLVLAIALMVLHRHKGLAASTIERGRMTRLVLVFDTAGDMLALAQAVVRMMKSWSEWTQVLLSMLARDPLLTDWHIDWREFLAGEAGFVTMDWYQPLSFQDRTDALSRIIETANALLLSILGQKQLNDPLVVQLRNWLGSLRPQAEVIGLSTRPVMEVL